MPKKVQPRKGLSDLELRVMEILWRQAPATAEQVREALAPERVLKDSTVRTILKRLKEKGYVDYKLEGKAFVYSVLDKPRNLAVRAVRQILDRFCDGSLEQLLAGMVENEVVDREELRRLARKLGSGAKSEKER